MDVLVCHDGELADVCAALRELGGDPVERRGAPPLPELARRFDLVVATPARALHLGTVLGRPETRSIVVAEPGTRTAGRRLHQLGVEWIVRRPVHPAALRLLLRHALYRGPERRRNERVTVGLPVRYRAGWLPRRALLRELSLRGASLLAPQRLTPGRRIALHIAEPGRPLTLRGEVVRCRPRGEGEVEIGIAFDPHPLTPLQELRRLLDRYATGPAVCTEASPITFARAAAPSVPPSAPETEAATAAGDRRGSSRRAYGRRVIAVGDEAPRVLIGRDLSLGGMCVEPGPRFAPGQRLRLALHVHSGDVPLVVEAEVVRADPSGAGLRFHDLDPAGRDYLAKMLDALPSLAAPSGASGEERRVLAELVDA
jgi:hypothetical protein